MTFATTGHAARAYGTAAATIRTPRDAERQVLTRATAQLRTAAADPDDFAGLARAIHDNRILWTRLAADIADGGNGLPQALRAQLFHLAQFTDRHSRQVLKGEAEVGALIDINMAVIRGLAGDPATQGVH